MLICRCAWHPRYYGYPLWSGVASWRGVAVQFTDGICTRCANRFREENRRFLERRRSETTATPADASAAPAA
jgi:hypothetical protein